MALRHRRRRGEQWLASLSEDGQTQEAYEYLGLATVVVRSQPQAGVELTYVEQSGDANANTDGGDPYTGLDRFGRVIDQNWVNTSTGTSTERYQYGYDRDGNVTSRNNLLDGSLNETYGYDDLSRLTNMTRGGVDYQSWDLDAVGNMNAITTAGTTQSNTFNDQNQMTTAGSATLAFDANGNTTIDDQGHTLVYDAWNRLVAVKDSRRANEIDEKDFIGCAGPFVGELDHPDQTAPRALRREAGMFVSEAHSFRQQAKLAITLAWVAGYTNILTLLACGALTSHMSGNTSKFGGAIFMGDWGRAGFLFFILASFFVGAGLSGFCTELGRRQTWESIYVLPIGVEAGLLAILGAMLIFHNRPIGHSVPAGWWMAGLAASAMGLQNATITRISHGVVRTTHVTGVITDLGHEGMQFLWWLAERRRNVPPGSAKGLLRSIHAHPPARQLGLLASILGTFALGAGLAAWAYDAGARWAMIPPVLFLAWLIYQDLTRPIAEIAPHEFSRNESLVLPESLAIYHLRKDHDRQGRMQRMPNLQAWAEQLPPRVRVVVLDWTDVTQMNANAALELRALMAGLAKEGRRILFAGLGAQQVAAINLLAAGPLLDAKNVCPDVEIAIAHGLNMAEEPPE